MNFAPVVLRVQPLYEKTGNKKRSLQNMSDHNSRERGNLVHIDSSKRNEILLGSKNAKKDVEEVLSQYPRSSKSGPVAGELILSANAKYFEKLTEEQKRTWAKDSLDWVLSEFDRKGNGQTVNCFWHRDEEAEHLHVIVVPVAQTITKNRYKSSSEKKINYSAVLGRPTGSERHLAPEQRRWGLKQTSYAEYMSSKGHSLIRGVTNRNVIHKAPREWRKETELYYDALNKQYPNNSDEKKITLTDSEFQRFLGKCLREKDSRIKTLSNQKDSLEQLLQTTAKSLGCENPFNLPTHVKHMQTSLDFVQVILDEKIPHYNYLVQDFKSLSNYGKDIEEARKEQERKKIEQERKEEERKKIEAKELARQALNAPRRTKGQRKTKEERRANREAKKLILIREREKETTMLFNLKIQQQNFQHQQNLGVMR